MQRTSGNISKASLRALKASVLRYNLLFTVTIKQMPGIKAKYVCESTKHGNNAHGKWKSF